MEFAELIKTPRLDDVLLKQNLQPATNCSLCITGHHLILSSRRESEDELWLLLAAVDAVDRRPTYGNNVLTGGTIILRCKDLRTISLTIAERPSEFVNIADSIEHLSNLEEVNNLYPFFYRSLQRAPLENVDGYSMFLPEEEFTKVVGSDEHWRLTEVNADYRVCLTYPEKIFVPANITDEEIRQSAAFREGGRFPTLAYRHSNGAILLKSSQPVQQMGGGPPKRCRADEAILNVVLGPFTKGYIIDTWSKSSKMTAEIDHFYTQWRKVARPLGSFSSPSGILDAFMRLVEACVDTNCSSERWISRLESSGWLTLVTNALNASCVVSQCLDKETTPVLVHGGSGLDSPPLIASIAQLILNPECRTVRGFLALIEREWLQAGHPFTTRNRHAAFSTSQYRTKHSGATFALFLDCVYQLHYQFVCSFEFRTDFLIILFEHSYFSQYGTFLGDCERQRRQLKVFTRTTSLWAHLLQPEVLEPLLNPSYEPNPDVIWPSVAPVSIELWSQLYLRWVIDQRQDRMLLEKVAESLKREKELIQEAQQLRDVLWKLVTKKEGADIETNNLIDSPLN